MRFSNIFFDSQGFLDWYWLSDVFWQWSLDFSHMAFLHLFREVGATYALPWWHWFCHFIEEPSYVTSLLGQMYRILVISAFAGFLLLCFSLFGECVIIKSFMSDLFKLHLPGVFRLQAFFTCMFQSISSIPETGKKNIVLDQSCKENHLMNPFCYFGLIREKTPKILKCFPRFSPAKTRHPQAAGLDASPENRSSNAFWRLMGCQDSLFLMGQGLGGASWSVLEGF